MSARERFYVTVAGWLLALAIITGSITAYYIAADMALVQMVSNGHDPLAVRCAMEARF